MSWPRFIETQPPAKGRCMLNRGGMFRFGTSLFVSILCFAGTSAMAQGTGQPTDPQIAHIAYTVGQIDIKAAKQQGCQSLRGRDDPGSRSGKQAGARVGC